MRKKKLFFILFVAVAVVGHKTYLVLGDGDAGANTAIIGHCAYKDVFNLFQIGLVLDGKLFNVLPRMLWMLNTFFRKLLFFFRS